MRDTRCWGQRGTARRREQRTTASAAGLWSIRRSQSIQAQPTHRLGGAGIGTALVLPGFEKGFELQRGGDEKPRTDAVPDEDFGTWLARLAGLPFNLPYTCSSR